MYDVDAAWSIEKIRDFRAGLSQGAATTCERLLNRNRIFIDRTKGIGVLTREEAINRSCTGPVARASGVIRDLRKDEPYLAYKRFRFQGLLRHRPAIATPATWCAWRRCDESLKIVAAGDREPAGRAGQRGRRRADASCPNKQQVYRTIEGLISHFELVMSNRGFEVPVDEVYAAIESPNGELGFYIVGDGTGVAYRARCRPPSFIHFAVFPHLIRGHTLSDVVAVLGSLNIIAAELDR